MTYKRFLVVLAVLTISPLLCAQSVGSDAEPADSETVHYLPRGLERQLSQSVLAFERSRNEAYRSYLAILMTAEGIRWQNAEQSAKTASSNLQDLQKKLSDYCLQFGGMQLNMEEARCEKPPPGTVEKLLQGKSTKENTK